MQWIFKRPTMHNRVCLREVAFDEHLLTSRNVGVFHQYNLRTGFVVVGPPRWINRVVPAMLRLIIRKRHKIFVVGFSCEKFGVRKEFFYVTLVYDAWRIPSILFPFSSFSSSIACSQTNQILVEHGPEPRVVDGLNHNAIGILTSPVNSFVL